MRKDQLVRAILKVNRAKKKAGPSRRQVSKVPTKRSRVRSASARAQAGNSGAASPRVRKRIRQLQARLEQIKNLASTCTMDPPRQPEDDRLVLMVREPYWLHAWWELSLASIDRARAAMGQRWHAAAPVLRLYQVGDGGSATVLRDIRIHGGVNNWYVDVQDPPRKFRMDIGYLSDDGDFHRLATSNVVTTPPPGISEALDESWADLARNADRIFAMSGGYSAEGSCRELQELLEERLGRPMGSPMQTRHGAGAAAPDAHEFQLAVDAEVLVYGATQRNAHVTLRGEPVRLRPDGTFTVRLHLPERRQVIPVVASSSDGVEQRTISIAVERNTKVMEPVIREMGQ